jgi:L-gulonate 5-dehydrogenase
MNIAEAPEPHALPGHALIDVVAVGLCGSDYHLFDGSHPDAHFPRTQGHEFAGIVRELPEGHDGRLRAGDLVAVEPMLACGECFACRRGRTNCCVRLEVIGSSADGALSERISVPVHLLHATSDLDPELAALAEPVSIGLHAVRRSAARAGDTVLVLGGGPIGLAATLAASDRGCRVVVADRVPARLQRATEAGASIVVDSERADLAAVMAEVTDGDGPGVVVDATGAATLIRTAVDIVAHAGTVVVVGISADDLVLPVALLSRKELSLLGSRNSAGDFAAAIDLVRRHARVVRSWITHRVALDEVPTAIAFARSHPELVEKMIVRVGAA